MNQIQELPEPTTYGYDFNYANWTAGTQVTLANVPWNSDYRDIVRFDNEQALDEYILNSSGPVINNVNLSYSVVGRPIRLDVPFNAAYRFNYLRAFNPAQPVQQGDVPRIFYYFILDIRYLAPNNTEFVIQLDVWQTFGYGITFGNSYIERGHIGIANANQFEEYGRQYLNIPEGVDIGAEYNIAYVKKRSIGTSNNHAPQDDVPAVDGPMSVMVISTVSLLDDPGTVDAPKLHSAKGSGMEGLPNGCEIYIFDTVDIFKDFLEDMFDKPWITQGIISVNLIPGYSTYSMNVSSIPSKPGIHTVGSGSLKRLSTKMMPKWRDVVKGLLPVRYKNLLKFITFPYCAIELTTNTGTPVIIKPESWQDEDATIVEVPHFAPPSPRVAFYPFRYNASFSSPSQSTVDGVYNDGGEFLDMATGIMNFPSFSIVNNGYMSFLASNHNSLAYQNSSADWSQQRALTSNNLAFDQASSGMELSQNINSQQVNATNLSNNLSNETAGMKAVTGAIGSITGGIASGPTGILGGLGSAAMTGVNTAIDINRNNQQTTINNNLSTGMNRSQVNQSGYIRDTNKAYADYAARGDYQNAIAGINAKVQDAKLTQPTTSGQVGGDAFNIATYKMGYDVKIKMLQGSAMSSVGEYWLRYGYQINRFSRVPGDLHVMQNFTYWKLRETYITSSSCPESFKQTIRGIFEKGVTVWRNPQNIGNIDIANNSPLEGIVL